jgi:4-hydroxy-tetrahydrodipicolinate reductase
MEDIAVGIAGCAGRTGVALLREILAREGCRLAGGSVRPGSPAEGRDLGEIAGPGPLGRAATADAESLFSEARVVIDFTVPGAAARHAKLAARNGTALVVGTTALDAAAKRALDEAASSVPVLEGANMSLPVNFLIEAVRQAAERLGPEYDVEILDLHNWDKQDAPSGTALELGRAVAAGRGVALDEVALRGRDGHTGKRPKGAIGFATLRGGDVAGENTVLFVGQGERLELGHRTWDRSVYARGALTAALWLAADRPPGLYAMRDVLGH